MKAIKFNLSGNFAFFKKPEYNKQLNNFHSYITFNQIPKTNVLGILGSLLGYPSFDKENNYYSKLKNVKISIIPKKDHFLKEEHKYVDHTAKQFTKNGNILINEELLYKPSWDIILSDLDLNQEIFERIRESLLNRKAKCHLYLGKNEFFAKISDVKIIEELSKVEKDRTKEENFIKIDSLFIPKEELSDKDLVVSTRNAFLYKEFLPVGFNENREYIYKLFYFTNKKVEKNKIDFNSIYENKEEGELLCLF